MLLLEWFVEVDVIQEGPSSDAAAVFVSFQVLFVELVSLIANARGLCVLVEFHMCRLLVMFII